jgi:molybdenum cofactor synthesis domain-containing protein
MSGKIHSINISEKKGVQKTPVESVEMVNDFGIKTDAHAGKWHRQVSFLAQESIDKMVAKGLNVKGGDFAENITTIGVDLVSMKVGERLKIADVEFVISQLGKLCHNRCAIYHAAGDCVMPREGIFGVVKGNGGVKLGDTVEKLPKESITVAVVTLSDKGSKGERVDETGPALIEMVKKELNPSFTRLELIPDEVDQLKNIIKYLIDIQGFDLVITNGSTGLSPRDIAPDATIEMIEKRLPGFEEAMRMESFKKTPHALLSRAVCGTRKDSIILNVPGSPKGAVENLGVVIKALPHAIKKLQGDTADCAAK